MSQPIVDPASKPRPVFRHLLSVILSPALDDHTREEIDCTAALLEQVNGAVLSEVLLVPGITASPEAEL